MLLQRWLDATAAAELSGASAPADAPPNGAAEPSGAPTDAKLPRAPPVVDVELSAGSDDPPSPNFRLSAPSECSAAAE